MSPLAVLEVQRRCLWARLLEVEGRMREVYARCPSEFTEVGAAARLAELTEQAEWLGRELARVRVLGWDALLEEHVSRREGRLGS